MTVVFMDGGQLYEASTGNGEDLSNTPGIVWSGSNDTKVIAGEGRYGNKICFGSVNSISGRNTYNLPSQPTGHFWLNWAMRRNQNHSSNRYAMGVRAAVGSNNYITIILANNGTAQLWIGQGSSATLVASSVNTFSIDEWVDLRMRVNVLNGEIQAYANDENFFTGFDAAYPSGNITALEMGEIAVPSAGSTLSDGRYYWSDIILSYDGPDLGRTALLYLFPNADETAQDWTPASGSDGYAMLDDNLASSVTEYVEASSVGDISQFDVQAPGISVFGLYAVAIQSFQTKTTTATAETDFVLTVNGTDYNSPAQNLSDASYVLEDYIWDQNPDTSAQWQVSDIAGLRMGFEKVT